MYVVAQVGPIQAGKDRATAYVAIDQHAGVDVELAPTEAQGLDKLLARLQGPVAFEPALDFAARVWNAVVADERGEAVGGTASLRGELAPGATPVAHLRHSEGLLARKRDRFGGDLRAVADLRLQRRGARSGVLVAAALPESLVAKARAAGIDPAVEGATEATEPSALRWS
jgi:hypothetical protein